MNKIPTTEFEKEETLEQYLERTRMSGRRFNGHHYRFSWTIDGKKEGV